MSTRLLPTLAAFETFANGDDLSMVLRSHLALEALLNAALADATSGVEGVDLERLPFGTKVEIAAAFDKVPLELVAGFRSANRLRNKFAHRLDAAISAEDANSLLGSLQGAAVHDLFGEHLVKALQDVRSGAPRDQVAFGFGALYALTSIHSDTHDLLPASDER